jgi:P-type conjugative transfer protein TrbL
VGFTVTGTGVLDQVLNNFTGAISGTWGPSLSAYLLPLLMGIVVLQFGLLAAEAAATHDIPLLLVHVMLGIIRIGIVVAIFQHAFDWGNDIVNTGQVLGDEISGFGLTPSGILASGAGIAHTIFHAKAVGSWYVELFEDVEFFLVGLFVEACWLAAAIIYLWTLIEASLLVYTGPLVIAFTPLSWTFDMLVVWGKSLLGIAFKLCLILMTLALGMTLASAWIADFTANATTLTSNIDSLLIAVIEAVLFAVCVWKIPNSISGLAAGAAALGFGEAVVAVAASRSASGAATAGGAAASYGAKAAVTGGKALAQQVRQKLSS